MACGDCGAIEACILEGETVGIDADDFRLGSAVGIDADDFRLGSAVGMDTDFRLTPPTG
jgi:hypothetical protein